jgi:hypothetical protein
MKMAVGPTTKRDSPALSIIRSRPQTKAASKTEFSCLTCGSNAWAKPNTNLICGDCMEPMEGEQGEGGCN